jgi:hypothetical protein
MFNPKYLMNLKVSLNIVSPPTEPTVLLVSYLETHTKRIC